MEIILISKVLFEFARLATNMSSSSVKFQNAGNIEVIIGAQTSSQSDKEIFFLEEVLQ